MSLRTTSGVVGHMTVVNFPPTFAVVSAMADSSCLVNESMATCGKNIIVFCCCCFGINDIKLWSDCNACIQNIRSKKNKKTKRTSVSHPHP